MIELIDLAQASREVAALLDHFALGDAPYSVQATARNHRRGGVDDVTIAIYVGLAHAFRREAPALTGALAQIRAELVEQFGNVP